MLNVLVWTFGYAGMRRRKPSSFCIQVVPACQALINLSLNCWYVPFSLLNLFMVHYILLKLLDRGCKSTDQLNMWF